MDAEPRPNGLKALIAVGGHCELRRDPRAPGGEICIVECEDEFHAHLGRGDGTISGGFIRVPFII